MNKIIEEIQNEYSEKDNEFKHFAKDLSEKDLYKLLGYMEGLKYTLERLRKNGSDEPNEL